jgi:hypothetical protein
MRLMRNSWEIGLTFKTVSDPIDSLTRGVLKSRTVFDATFLGNRLDFQDGI